MPIATVLPPLLVLTDRHLSAPRRLVDAVHDAVDGGARAVILREKDLSRGERAALADELAPILHDVGGRLIVASDPSIAGDGVHLARSDPFPDERPTIVGRSCHDLDEIRAAASEGCDYATLSPIYTTPSKPGYGPPLGPNLLADACLPADLPVYALGGVTPENAGECRRAGAAGVATMGAVMRDPSSTTRFVRAVSMQSAVPDRSHRHRHHSGARP